MSNICKHIQHTCVKPKVLANARYIYNGFGCAVAAEATLALALALALPLAPGAGNALLKPLAAFEYVMYLGGPGHHTPPDPPCPSHLPTPAHSAPLYLPMI
jgi:hypothetical protein